MKEMNETFNERYTCKTYENLPYGLILKNKKVDYFLARIPGIMNE